MEEWLMMELREERRSRRTSFGCMMSVVAGIPFRQLARNPGVGA